MVLVIWERPERKEELVSLVFGGLRYKDDDDDNDQNGKDGVKREGPVQCSALSLVVSSIKMTIRMARMIIMMISKEWALISLVSGLR